jgi:hypothetical protein
MLFLPNNWYIKKVHYAIDSIGGNLNYELAFLIKEPARNLRESVSNQDLSADLNDNYSNRQKTTRDFSDGSL